VRGAAQRLPARTGQPHRSGNRVCRDNGKGIDPKILDEGGLAGHYGLPGMQERARIAGGKLTVSSGPGSGAEAELIIPAAFAYAKSPALRQ
jgi:nitrate/nitrite-specific signal transduction histidine kinase